MNCECMNWARDGSHLTPFGHHKNCSKYRPIRVYRVMLSGTGSPCIEGSIDGVIGWIEGAEVGEIFTVQILGMDKEGFETLPEYQGP